MIDFIAIIISLFLIAFICAPLAVGIFIWNSTKTDIDHDGKEDIPYRWQ